MQHLKGDAHQPRNICDGVYVHVPLPLNGGFLNVACALALPCRWGGFISLNVHVCSHIWSVMEEEMQKWCFAELTDGLLKRARARAVKNKT